MDAGAALSVEELLDRAVDATVRTGDGTAGRELVAELDRRGEDAAWEGALLLLGVLATRPVEGFLPEDLGVKKLEQVASGTPDPVTALVLAMQAAHRPGGAAPARRLWERADSGIRRLALLQLLIAVCWSMGSDHGRLTPAQTVALVKRLVVAEPAH